MATYKFEGGALVVTSGSVGIKNDNPATSLHITDASGLASFKLEYDASNYMTKTISSAGKLTITTACGTGALGHIQLAPDGNVGIGNVTAPNEMLTVEGAIALDEISAPSHTAGYGKIYVKSSDSKLYFKNDSGTETDLTAGGAGGDKVRETGYVSLQNSARTLCWERNTTLGSASANFRGFFICPFAGSISAIIHTVKGSTFNATNDGTITMAIYKNSDAFDSADVTVTAAASTYTLTVDTGTDIYTKVLTPSLTFSQGDILQINVSKDVAGNYRDTLVTLVVEAS